VFLTGCGGEEDPHNDHGGHDHSAMTEEPATGKSDYPLTTCVVSGEALGSMGTPVEVVHNGVKVKLCCKSCIDDFKATPEVFVAKVKAGS
ncbi:MAG: hypothetical protein AAF357_13335, partial [Verrucomicrobiota bacterium]